MLLSHPIIEALFSPESCDASKQLIAVRQRLTTSFDMPSILIVLPPAHLILDGFDHELMFKDSFLLSHVFDAYGSHDNHLTALNGSNWILEVTKDSITMGEGYPIGARKCLPIKNRFLWSPGYDFVTFDATYMVIEVDELLLNSECLQKFSWFGMGKSTPKPSFSKRLADQQIKIIAGAVEASLVARPNPDRFARIEGAVIEHTEKLYSSRPQNPAKNLGANLSQREHNMARVDYSLACLQSDVVTSAELAQRFHHAVGVVMRTLIEAGGAFVSEEFADQEESEHDLGPNTFTTASIYRYAEYRLSRQLLSKLDQLLEGEQHNISFKELHDGLRYLDIGQVDIPNLDQVDRAAFERAVGDAALALGRLGQTRNAHDMCRVFLGALETLANPILGTVSADTLLGLFMLTVLRTSEDCAAVLERDLFFVLHFSFQTSDSAAARASAGRLSYTLMVVESVLLQLRMEHTRLLKLANCNKAVWDAIRNDERESLLSLAEQSPTSLTSRNRGRSILFMTIEDNNKTLLSFILDTLPNIFTKRFILRDRDPRGLTLLMAACKQDVELAKILLGYLTHGSPDVDEELAQYFCAVDSQSRGLAFYITDPRSLGEKYESLLDFKSKDSAGLTGIIYQTLKHNLGPFLPFVSNFFNHLDPSENSLLHLVADNPDLVQMVVQLPSCDLNWTNIQGRPALQSAQNSPVSIDILLKNGADPWLPFYLESPIACRKLITHTRNYPCVVRASKSNKNFEVITYENGTLQARRHNYQCFQSLKASLSEQYPSSWVPPLPEIRPEYSPSDEIYSMFSHILISLENIKLSIWLSTLCNHATFQNSSILSEFFTHKSVAVAADSSEDSVMQNKAESQTGHDGNNSEIDSAKFRALEKTINPLSRIDQQSMMAFINLAQEHLHSLSLSMENLVRTLSRVDTLELQNELLKTQSEHNMALNLAQQYQTSLVIKRNEMSRHFQGSYSSRVVRTSLSQLITAANDISNRFNAPKSLCAELETEKELYEGSRATLKKLAQSNGKSAWFPPSESKRIAEINNLETQVSSSKQRMGELQTQITETHFSLASELSSFKKTQEEELFSQIKMYSATKLQSAKDGLKRLEFGYRCSP